jgi:hypothetical protein
MRVTSVGKHPVKRLLEPAGHRNGTTTKPRVGKKPQLRATMNQEQQVQRADPPLSSPAVTSAAIPFRQEWDMGRILTVEDPDRMRLTRQEYENAMAIKEMIEGLPDVDNLSDLMYAHYAIVCKDDLEDVVQRCYALQEFRKEYKILDSYVQGCRCLQSGMELFPRQYLSFSFSWEEGKYVFLHDVQKFEPKEFTNFDMVHDWLRMMYYLHILFFPDLESIRKGVIIGVDCQDMTLRRDVMKYFKLLFDDLMAYFPHSGQCRMFNTGTIMNTIASLLRKILPPEMKDNFQVGYQYEGNMADDFLTPSVEAANQKMLRRMQYNLRQRYTNEMVFSLEDYKSA